jgi:repressor LexA
MELPDRQQRILRFIEETVESQGYPPTVREIGVAVGLCSPASVQSNLASLESKGLIRRGSAKRRALEVVRAPGVGRGSSGSARNRIPLVGRVAAGAPLLATESSDESIYIPDFLGEPDGCFALRVTGSSMINAGILNGDVVVVKRQDTAEDGDIVVAMLDDEATLKRFFREADQVRLQPENDSMAPIFTRDPRIVGRVTGVLRRL